MSPQGFKVPLLYGVVGSLGASLLKVVWRGHPGGSCPEQRVWWLNM